MSETEWQRMVLALAEQIRDVVAGVYQERLEAALVDLCVLADLVEASGDAELTEAARALIARNQPGKRQWHDHCGDVRH